MLQTNTPVHLWSFCYNYTAYMLSLCDSGRFDIQVRAAYESVMKYIPDISDYASLSWFQWCYFYDKNLNLNQLFWWLGPFNGVGQFSAPTLY